VNAKNWLRDVFNDPPISPGVCPRDPVGGIPPTAATALPSFSCGRRPQRPEPHQVV